MVKKKKIISFLLYLNKKNRLYIVYRLHAGTLTFLSKNNFRIYSNLCRYLLIEKIGSKYNFERYVIFCFRGYFFIYMK